LFLQKSQADYTSSGTEMQLFHVKQTENGKSHKIVSRETKKPSFLGKMASGVSRKLDDG